MIFDHIGCTSAVKKDNSFWVENTRVWVTNPKDHPFMVEWLYYEPDSPCPDALKNNPHVAYRIKNLDEAAKGLKLLLGPMIVDEFVRVGFYQYKDGSVVELMEYLRDENEWFPKQQPGG
jgi:hypothetical protein